MTMARAVSSTDILRWPVTSQWPSSRRLKLWRICYIRLHKIIPRALLYEQVVKTTQIAYSGLFWAQISCVTWLVYRSHRRDGHGSNFLTAVTYSSQSNSKLFVQKKNTYQTPQSNLPIVCVWESSIKSKLSFYIFRHTSLTEILILCIIVP